MVKRLLTEDEKRVTEKNLAMIKDDLEYKEKVDLARKKFNLEIADLEVEKQKNEIKASILKLESEVNEYKNAIETIERQLKEGVEIKEVTDDIEDEELSDNQ